METPRAVLTLRNHNVVEKNRRRRDTAAASAAAAERTEGLAGVTMSGKPYGRRRRRRGSIASQPAWHLVNKSFEDVERRRRRKTPDLG